MQCEGTSKKTGERCTASAAKGGTLCAGHAGMGIAANPHAYARQGAERTAVVRREKAEERRKTLLDRIADGLEERAGEILAAYLAAGLEKGDWRALEALVTRVHGRPVERTEDITSRDVAGMTVEERDRLRSELLDSFPHLRKAA